MEGYCSIEEHAQSYIELFLMLQKKEEKQKLFREGYASVVQREEHTEIFLPAVYLRNSCSLTEAEYWLVMFAFCCEIEEGLCLDYQQRRQERLPDIQYAFHLLSFVIPVDFELIARLCSEGSVLRDMFMLPAEETRTGGILTKPLQLMTSVFYFLLTGEIKSEEWYRVVLPGEQKKLLQSEAYISIHEQAYELICRYLDEEPPVHILLKGASGSGKHTLLQEVCNKRNTNLLFLHGAKIQRLTEDGDRDVSKTIRMICRMTEPIIAIESAGITNDTVSEQEKGMDWIEKIWDMGLAKRRLVLMAESRMETEALRRYADLQIALEETLTKGEIGQALDSYVGKEERRDWQDALVWGYRPNIGELKKKYQAISRRAQAERISLTDQALWDTGLREGSGNSRWGRVIEETYAWEDIVLPKDCERQLAIVIELAKNWNGRQGLHILFHGNSGTGKTMAASVLAAKLHLPLFKVDLSRVHDKYIGETEKHMDEIFRLAQSGRYLLFFDEADALFGKRTDIKDSHDKYANASTAYLLQRIEEYDGILILATNLMDHFDDAFVRRIRFVIKFHHLDTDGRKQMWENALQGKRPLAEDVSCMELAQAAELSPARIKAAAQVAKILASCGESGSITKDHIRKALELEAGKDETIVRRF